MQPVDRFLWAAVLLVGLGLWILASHGFAFLLNLSFGLSYRVRRRLAPRLLRQLQAFAGQEPSAPEPGKAAGVRLLKSLLDLRLTGWILACLVAGLAHDVLLSPVLLAGTAVLGEVLRGERAKRRRSRLNEDAGNLILQFASRYPLLRSVRAGLEKSAENLPNRELRENLAACLQRLRVGQPVPEALKGLARLPVPSLSQFAAVLAATQSASPEVLLDSLAMLRQDVESRLLLGQQIRQSLTLLGGTVRILQGTLLASLLAAGLLPAWRAYFLASLENWLKLLLAVLVGVGGSLYVEAEMHLLEVE